MKTRPEDLDYLAARVHGRRSRIAEGDRLVALCRVRSLDELARTVLPGPGPMDASAFHRRLAVECMEEMEELASGLNPSRARMLKALSDRLHLEERKRLMRSLAAGRPDMADASLADFMALLPEQLQNASPDPFTLECALDRVHFLGLLKAMRGLDGNDRGEIRALIAHQVDHFHLMLAARGHFFHGLEPEALLPWHVEGTGIARKAFGAMLAAQDLRQAAALALGTALDELPDRCEDATVLDTLARRRFLRLARRTFRQGSMAFSALVGYAALRLAEVGHLTTLAEGLRLGLPADALRTRMEAADA